MQVLIVDDNRLILLALNGLLVEAGHTVLVANNGREALELLRTNSGCRMVISDWEMPEMNGLELCRAVRDQSTGYVYFVLLTSHGSSEEVIQGLSAGADDFMTKPYSPAEVLARLRSGERVLAMETRDVAIFAMARLAESRDNDTGAHLERVQHYCRALAQHLATTPKYQGVIDAEYIRLIFQTSPLHDIGKVGVPDAILLKPGRLEPHEFEIMKGHTTIAADTLNDTLKKFPGVSFLEMARDIAAGHHERIDGKGYPAGLAGDAIPLSARIVALADVYDALTSKRIYKAAMSHETSKGIILEECGTHFDTDVVDAFLAIEKEFQITRQRFEDVIADPNTQRKLMV